jgi:hypothetical protein
LMTESGAPGTRSRWYDANLLRAHVEHGKLEDIIAATGLSRRTIQRWRADAQNRERVEQARRDVLAGALNTLRSGLHAAAARLVGIARDSAAEGVAVRAALGLFEAHRTLSERLELDSRLSVLERCNRPGADVLT